MLQRSILLIVLLLVTNLNVASAQAAQCPHIGDLCGFFQEVTPANQQFYRGLSEDDKKGFDELFFEVITYQTRDANRAFENAKKEMCSSCK